MKILVFGRNGHVAQAIIALAAQAGHICDTVTSAADADGSRLDMRDAAAVERFALPKGELYDGIVFAQGINPSRGLEQISVREFEDMLRVNVVAPALLARSLRPHLRPGGAMVMLGSAATRRGSYDPSYGASKAALEGLMNSLSRYDPEHRYLIVSLALVDGSPVSRTMPAERRQQHASTMFGGRLISAADVARVVLEAIANPGLNRTILQVDGGMWT